MRRKKPRGRRKISGRRRAVPPAPRRSKARDQVAAMEKLLQPAAAWLIGVTDRTLRDALDAPRNGDLTYSGRLLVTWWIERSKSRARGGPSAAQERLLEARAAAAERRGAIEAGKLVLVEHVQGEARAIAHRLRAHLDQELRALGPEAERRVNAAIEAFERDLSQVGASAAGNRKG